MQKIRPFLSKGLVASLLLPSAVTKAEQAIPINDPAAGWDQVWDIVIFDISIMGILFALLTVYFVVRYRRRDPDQVGSQPKLTAATAVGWALIPAFIFMADDFYLAAKGWKLWNDYRQVPAERMEIQLESGMYSWDYTYPNGVQAQNELRVPVGKPIMLRMTSRDVVHSHYIHKFRVKEDSMPGRVTYMWFYPKDVGEYIVSCNEYCGIMHSLMTGKVIAMPEDEFNQWYEESASKVAMAETTVEPEATPTVAVEPTPAATETEASPETSVEPEVAPAVAEPEQPASAEAAPETAVEPESTPTVEVEPAPAATETEATVAEPEQPASAESAPESAEPAATGSSEESETPATE